jgi:exonuclease VII small subunit
MGATQLADMLSSGLEQNRARLKQALLEREKLWERFSQVKRELDEGIYRLTAEIESIRFAIKDYEGAVDVIDECDRARATDSDQLHQPPWRDQD